MAMIDREGGLLSTANAAERLRQQLMEQSGLSHPLNQGRYASDVMRALESRASTRLGRGGVSSGDRGGSSKAGNSGGISQSLNNLAQEGMAAPLLANLQASAGGALDLISQNRYQQALQTAMGQALEGTQITSAPTPPPSLGGGRRKAANKSTNEKLSALMAAGAQQRSAKRDARDEAEYQYRMDRRRTRGDMEDRLRMLRQLLGSFGGSGLTSTVDDQQVFDSAGGPIIVPTRTVTQQRGVSPQDLLRMFL